MVEAFFTAKELASYLRLDYDTIITMSQRRELPLFRVGKSGRQQYRFPVKAIEDWVKAQVEGGK